MQARRRTSELPEQAQPYAPASLTTTSKKRSSVMDHQESALPLRTTYSHAEVGGIR